jgi:hypothetical protein
MRYRITLVPLLGLALLTLVALAHASAPDETWQPGIYDDADFDDVITLITLLSGAPPDAPAAVLHHGPIAPSIVLLAESGALPTRLRRPDDARSPPSS